MFSPARKVQIAGIIKSDAICRHHFGRFGSVGGIQIPKKLEVGGPRLEILALRRGGGWRLADFVLRAA